MGQSGTRGVVLGAAMLFGAFAVPSCTNNPYPGADEHKKILYSSFAEAPRTLDPAVAYSVADHAITGKVYDTLLEYHYLKRPFELIPGLAERVPEAEPALGDQVVYRFRLRDDLWFQKDPCFSLSGSDQRRISAKDVVFELQRIADPKVNSPVIDPFSNLVGFREFRAALKERRADPAFAAKPVHEQYAAIGGIEGAKAQNDRDLVLTLKEPYPQILFWFAMPFSSPVPWEAIEYYDGEGGRDLFDDHPVSSGPFVLTTYDKQAKMVLDRNESWYGVMHPEWKAPGATFPELPPGLERAEEFRSAVGKSLPFLERVEYLREKERIPAFSKFLQGYYDSSGIVRESFDKVIQEDGLSPEMQEKGMQLDQSVEPAVYYIGFNMDDPVVGRKDGERSRKLRQAMSLAVDVNEYMRLFMNSRGIPAQSPLPPGLFGYDEGYENPFREVNLARAKKLLEEAGYPGGIDSKTKAPLRLTFDVPDTSPEGRLRFMFWVGQWRRLGIDVELDATTYNAFQKKVRDGAYQIFQWGWVADYPDPENFFFLLTSEMARSVSGGPNTANFKNEEYDRLFGLMRTRENDERRTEIIAEMTKLLEQERPWIELFHPEQYALFQGWMKYVKPVGISTPVTKYYDLDPDLRAEKRREWNQPVMWPLGVLIALLVLVLIPGIRTFLQERQ